MRRAIVALVVAGAAIAIGYLVASSGNDRQPIESAGPADGCMYCHASPDHDPGGLHTASRVPCQACHLGDPTARTLDAAHVGLEREPGALDTADRTCGTCHQVELERVRRSLMATGSGIIAVNRWAFGEVPHPRGDETFRELLDTAHPTPAQDHLRRLCAGCHLETRSHNRDDAVTGIGSGCSACHVGTEDTGVHPPVDGVVPSARCVGCHSRSSRISLSYHGLAEADGGWPCDEPEVLFDGRPGCRVAADVHADAGMGCTDCHVHTELMGDGTHHTRQRLATEVRCETCHTPSGQGSAASPGEGSGGVFAEIPWAEVDDPISRALLRLRDQRRADDELARVTANGTPLWNLRPADAGWALTTKETSTTLTVPPTPADQNHQLPGHERLACASCHSAWIPTCATCHTDYEPESEQWDFGVGAVASGQWVETHAQFGFGPPTLAVLPDDSIGPAAPGMISTLDATAAGGAVTETRFYAAFDPHTTSRDGRSCASCHRSALAVGFGAGTLTFGERPEDTVFTPTSPDARGLATDRWVAPGDAEPGASTFPGVRSLDAGERATVLAVGFCLGCHGVDAPIWEGFEASRSAFAAGMCAASP